MLKFLFYLYYNFIVKTPPSTGGILLLAKKQTATPHHITTGKTMKSYILLSATLLLTLTQANAMQSFDPYKTPETTHYNYDADDETELSTSSPLAKKLNFYDKTYFLKEDGPDDQNNFKRLLNTNGSLDGSPAKEALKKKQTILHMSINENDLRNGNLFLEKLTTLREQELEIIDIFCPATELLIATLIDLANESLKEIYIWNTKNIKTYTNNYRQGVTFHEGATFREEETINKTIKVSPSTIEKALHSTGKKIKVIPVSEDIPVSKKKVFDRFTKLQGKESKVLLSFVKNNLRQYYDNTDENTFYLEKESK